MNKLEYSKEKQKQKQKQKQTVGLLQVYQEFFRHPDNWLFVMLGFASLCWLVYDGLRLSDLMWFFLGWAVFLPQEYFTHVYVLHRRQPKSKWAYKWLYRLHYGHHDLPKRHDLMYMPLWLTVPMTIGNIFILWAFTPTPHDHLAAFLGATWAYALFEWTHLMFHTPYIPKNSLWKKLRQKHLMHHFYNEKQWFSVAPLSPCMDWLMTTGQDREVVRRSESCRYLGLHQEHEWVREARAEFAHRSSGTVEASRLWR